MPLLQYTVAGPRSLEFNSGGPPCGCYWMQLALPTTTLARV